MEFKLKTHPDSRIMYIPKAIYGILGRDVIAIPNRTTVLCYNKETNLSDVLAGLEFIQADIKHALEMEDRLKGT